MIKVDKRSKDSVYITIGKWVMDRVDNYPTKPYILLYERKKYAKNNK